MKNKLLCLTVSCLLFAAPCFGSAGKAAKGIYTPTLQLLERGDTVVGGIHYTIGYATNKRGIVYAETRDEKFEIGGKRVGDTLPESAFDHICTIQTYGHFIAMDNGWMAAFFEGPHFGCVPDEHSKITYFFKYDRHGVFGHSMQERTEVLNVHHLGTSTDTVVGANYNISPQFADDITTLICTPNLELLSTRDTIVHGIRFKMGLNGGSEWGECDKVAYLLTCDKKIAIGGKKVGDTLPETAFNGMLSIFGNGHYVPVGDGWHAVLPFQQQCRHKPTSRDKIISFFKYLKKGCNSSDCFNDLHMDSNEQTGANASASQKVADDIVARICTPSLQNLDRRDTIVGGIHYTVGIDGSAIWSDHERIVYLVTRDDKFEIGGKRVGDTLPVSAFRDMVSIRGCGHYVEMGGGWYAVFEFQYGWKPDEHSKISCFFKYKYDSADMAASCLLLPPLVSAEPTNE